jgi:hypothetical protein
MKNAFFLVSTFTTLAFWALLFSGKMNFTVTNTEVDIKYDTIYLECIKYDTVYLESNSIPQCTRSNIFWTETEKIEFVKYINTQQRICNEDQWAVIQVMFNILEAGGWNWTEYSTKYHHEGTFFNRCRAGKIWSYTYNPDNARDKEIMRRLNLVIDGKTPNHLRIPKNIIAFESHPAGWNKGVKKGLWQRNMIGLTLDHEFYYDWSKVTDKERATWKHHLQELERTYRNNLQPNQHFPLKTLNIYLNPRNEVPEEILGVAELLKLEKEAVAMDAYILESEERHNVSRSLEYWKVRFFTVTKLGKYWNYKPGGEYVFPIPIVFEAGRITSGVKPRLGPTILAYVILYRTVYYTVQNS